MRIDHVQLHTLELPLVTPFTTSFGTQTVRRALIVELHADVDGRAVVGWGEVSALEAPIYSSEYREGVIDVATRFLLPALAQAQETAPLTAEGIGPALAHLLGHRMAKSGLEAAALDAQLRASGTSFADYLGVRVDRVPSAVSVGIQDSIAELLDAVAGYVDAGYQRIKLKIEPGWDIEPVRAVREAHPDVPLQVDANTAYTLADAEHLRELDKYGLLLIEQPLGEDDIREHAELATMMTTPMCLDESIVSVASARDAIELGAVGIINIKPSRVGGYLESVRIHDLARRCGIPVWCGGMLETGIGRAANTALAGLPGFSLPGDISGSSRFYAEDITTPLEPVDGWMSVPRGPGMCEAPDPDRLAALTVATAEIAVTASAH
jgi:O-succinylbenzoate synthase